MNQDKGFLGLKVDVLSMVEVVPVITSMKECDEPTSEDNQDDYQYC